MTRTLPKVAAVPCQTPARAVVDWDRDALVLQVSLVYPPAPEPVPSLSDRLDDAFGLGAEGARVTLGDVDVALDAERRPVAIDLRTNPAGWAEAAPLPAPETRGTVHIDAALDENHLATFDVPLHIARSGSTLTITFASFKAARWIVVADAVRVGLTRDDYLAALAIGGVRA